MKSHSCLLYNELIKQSFLAYIIYFLAFFKKKTNTFQGSDDHALPWGGVGTTPTPTKYWLLFEPLWRKPSQAIWLMQDHNCQPGREMRFQQAEPEPGPRTACKEIWASSKCGHYSPDPGLNRAMHGPSLHASFQ